MRAQQNFAKSTQVLEKKIEDKSVFLDIIKQVQLPSVQVQVRTVEEMEKMEGKTRMMAAYIYFVLYKQITGIRAHRQVVPLISDVR